MAWRVEQRTVCALYFCLYLLYPYPGLGKTPDNNEGLKGFQPFDGDILLTKDQRKIVEDLANRRYGSDRSKRAVVVLETRKWPNGVVPYEISASMGEHASQVIQEAIAEYEAQTCITFRAKTADDEDYVLFYRGEGCLSSIGRVGGEQTISIGYQCESKGVVLHEIFHALGRWHEHSRPDRDQYIRILTENIQPVYLPNFDIEDVEIVDTQGVTYDYDSIMHYGATAFSLDGRLTIQPIDGSVIPSRLGQRNGFSTGDFDHINALYCEGLPGEWSAWGQWSACTVTCNGGFQTRMRVCEGGINCTGSNIEKRLCNEEPCAKPATWGPWSPWTKCTQSCGGGRITRVRSCQNGNICVGQRQEFNDCNEHECPLSSEWSEWGNWSSCNQTCQGGIQTRERFCHRGNEGSTCSGNAEEQQPCNSDVPCVMQLPNVSEWGECTKLCGRGVQIRLVGDIEEKRTCNEQPCHDEICLSGLTHLGCYRVPSHGLESYEGFTDSLSDDPHTRTEPVRKCAASAMQDGYTFLGLAADSRCYSGPATLEDFRTAGTSNLCADFQDESVVLAVDVYSITDLQAFQETAQMSETCGKDFCTTRDVECSAGRRTFVNVSLFVCLALLACVSLIFV